MPKYLQRWTLLTIFVPVAVAAQAPAPAAGAPATGNTPAATGSDVPVDMAPAPVAVPERFELASILRGEGQPLTADLAAKRALETAPSVERAAQNLEILRQQSRRTVLEVMPRLELSATYRRLSPVTNQSLGTTLSPAEIAAAQGRVDQVQDPAARQLFQSSLDQQVALSGFTFPVFLNNYILGARVSVSVRDVALKLKPAIDGSKAAKKSRAMLLDAERAEVELRAREAFYEFGRARGALAVAEHALLQAQTQERRTSALVTVGSRPKVDALRMQARVASAQSSLARAKAGLETSTEALRALLHIEPRVEFRIEEDVLRPLPDLHADYGTLLTMARRERLEVQAARVWVDAQQAAVSAQRVDVYPNLELSADGQYLNPNQRQFPQRDRFSTNWVLSAGLTWSPNDSVIADTRVQELRAGLIQAEADLRSLEDALRSEVRGASEDYNACKQMFDAAKVGLEAAEASYQVQAKQYSAGMLVLTDLIEADNAVTQARLAMIDAAISLHLARARLVRAVGVDPMVAKK